MVPIAWALYAIGTFLALIGAVLHDKDRLSLISFFANYAPFILIVLLGIVVIYGLWVPSS
jgi:hypothetical protein